MKFKEDWSSKCFTFSMIAIQQIQMKKENILMRVRTSLDLVKIRVTKQLICMVVCRTLSFLYNVVVCAEIIFLSYIDEELSHIQTPLPDQNDVTAMGNNSGPDGRKRHKRKVKRKKGTSGRKFS